MRRYLLLGLLLASITAQAATSLRVGDKVLTIGDSAAYVQQLMGPPTVRTYLHRTDGSLTDDQVSRGEQWQYVQDNKIEIITIVNGKVTDFQTQYH
ncbi:DUF2845 domain-containing protein [Dyella nitratireducens]|uniref:DUF2845 domain-containing protein n=1 Tax=Dyella nitratireducens TaxID=1849580 RepID=A0ABQ1GES7_9GAMM|nr:DUF2845 domain-containing protein [Dyella nitratireducens]GGA42465.1 hypothetical protein GCM10010981_34460 [Dyella nitratireducens]GLQ41997.1 hypothetical protein GCM10007902_18470 [Dyella nitratireducens]